MLKNSIKNQYKVKEKTQHFRFIYRTHNKHITWEQYDTQF